MSEKQNALEALLGADIEIEETVYIKRLKADFTIKALTGDEVNKLKEECTYIKGKGANRRQEVNEEEFGQKLIVSACIVPDFSNADLLKRYGAHDAADCVQKALLFGEIATLSHAVLDVSGVGQADEIEDAKN